VAIDGIEKSEQRFHGIHSNSQMASPHYRSPGDRRDPSPAAGSQGVAHGSLLS
jgi:hypothetical protein